MTQTEAIPTGYKKSEIGVIPEDWEVLPMKELGDFSKGQGIRKEESLSGNISCIRYGEIYTHHNNIVKKFYSRISPNIAKTSKKIKKGDILFAGSGETKEEIGKCVAFVGDEEVYAGGDIIIFSPKKGDSKFFGYLLNSPIIVLQKSRKGQGDAIVHISKSAVSSVNIPLPTKEEQIAIARVLSDTDVLIESLEKLIAKKKAIKQGAMQQLLTGKKRLPGFSGEWQVKKLGGIAEIKTGNKNNDDKVEEGLYPFFVRSQQVERINSYSFDGEAILVPGEGNIGGIYHYIDGRFDYHQRVYKISDFAKNCYGKYIYLCMSQNFNFHAIKNSVKATVDSLRLPTFQEFEISFPPTKDEQIAIANIVFDMDSEIEKLKQKRDKYILLKQGMMQQLLTGKIRLIKNGDN